ncbi:hypothetical protein [Mycobacterium sp. TY813]|uniref:hypothetical protein n=1 Tax=Mycobacterium TaxID=1763 RepID=UPI00274186AA|nr:hypothetical protein [Mycobacterium sp. TY813]MDP7731501.1 hypothetical protein [Mycobacterium sp. TY813]
MPDGATSGDYWTPVQNEPGVYYRNVEWGDVWSAGKEVVAAAVGVQYSDDRPIEQHISFESDDINGNGQMVEVTFDTAARLVDVLTTVIAGAI